MNPALTYRTTSFTGMINHGTALVGYVRDQAEQVPSTLEAEIRSGDYFVTLATRLDQLNQQVSDWVVRTELENAVSDLIYLQDHYTLTKRDTE